MADKVDKRTGLIQPTIIGSGKAPETLEPGAGFRDGDQVQSIVVSMMDLGDVHEYVIHVPVAEGLTAELLRERENVPSWVHALRRLYGTMRVASAEGTYDQSYYLLGMANGIRLSWAIVNGKEPEYLDMPKGKSSIVNILDMINDFDAQCTADQYTDTDEVWQIFTEIRNILLAEVGIGDERECEESTVAERVVGPNRASEDQGRSSTSDNGQCSCGDGGECVCAENSIDGVRSTVGDTSEALREGAASESAVVEEEHKAA